MDRPIAAAVRLRQRLRQAATLLVPLVALAALLVWLPGWMRPSVNRSRIRTATVTTGPIEAVITAGGTVAPEIERVLASPLDARVLRVLKRPGARVERGDPVVALDVSASVLALEKIVKDSRVKDNQQAQTRLALEKSLAAMDGQIEVKKLQLQALQAKAANDRQLAREGLLSRDALRQTELTAKQAEIELAQLETERRNTERGTGLQFEGLALERASIEKEAEEARRQLDLATAKADRDGVLTWVLPQEGALVRKGDVMARIADLTSFRVDASASDVHAGELRRGMPAIVQANDARLEGSVDEVFPTIDNGVVRFTVALRERSDARLRPSLRVDVLVITERKPRVLRVKRGPFADGSGAREAFVVRDDRAVRVPVEIGLAGFDDVEIASGLNEGDEVIISDMRDYLHLKELRVR